MEGINSMIPFILNPWKLLRIHDINKFNKSINIKTMDIHEMNQSDKRINKKPMEIDGGPWNKNLLIANLWKSVGIYAMNQFNESIEIEFYENQWELIKWHNSINN